MSACPLHAPILPLLPGYAGGGKSFPLLVWPENVANFNDIWFTIVRYGLGYFSGLVLIPNQPIFH